MNKAAFIEDGEAFEWEIERAGDQLLRKLGDELCINTVSIKDIKCSTTTLNEFLGLVS